ncbi:MAG: hypothetical protein J7K58_04980 [Euryarchaeota archaeon]|nr:hypothetical protein [Euryarchaeota archaeon]
MLLSKKLTVESVRVLENDYVIERGSLLLTLREGSHIITFKERNDVVGVYGTFDYLYRVSVELPFGKFSKEVSQETSGRGYIASKSSDLIGDILRNSREVNIESLEEKNIKSVALRVLEFLKGAEKMPEFAVSIGNSLKVLINGSSEVAEVNDVKVVKNAKNIVLKTNKTKLVAKSPKNIVFRASNGLKAVISGNNIVSEGCVIKEKSLVTRGIVAKDEDLASQEAAKIFSRIANALEEDGFHQEE